MEFRKFKGALQDFTSKQDILFDEYLRDHAKRNPPPARTAKPSIRFWMALVTGICAVGASGLRVYDRFFQVASQGGAKLWLSNLEAFFAVGAVNLAIVALALAVAYKQKKMSTNSMGAGLITAIVISLAAGLGQSFAGLKMDAATGVFDWILAISLAALTALEYLSGDLMGAELVNYDLDKQEKQKLYAQWLAAARRGVGAWQGQFSRWAQNEGIDIVDDGQEDEIRQSKPRTRVSNNANIIKTLLTELYSATNQIPTVTEVANLLATRLVEKGKLQPDGISEFTEKKKGYISTVRKAWMQEQGLSTS